MASVCRLRPPFLCGNGTPTLSILDGLFRSLDQVLRCLADIGLEEGALR
jgi:hypothetical protein